jgi:hypothetical protein
VVLFHLPQTLNGIHKRLVVHGLVVFGTKKNEIRMLVMLTGRKSMVSSGAFWTGTYDVGDFSGDDRPSAKPTRLNENAGARGKGTAIA